MRPGADSRQADVQALLVRSTLVLTVVGLMFGSAYFVLGARPMALSVGLGVVAGLANLLVLRLTGRPVLCSHVGIAIFFAVLVATSYFAGGLLSSDFSWLYLIPMLAAFLVGLRTAWAWVAVVWVTTLGFWHFDLGAGVEAIAPSGIELHALQNHFGVSLALALLTTVFLRSLHRTRERLEDANLWLGQEVARRAAVEVELRENESRFRDLVEKSPALLCTHDPNGVVLSANRSLRRFLGYDAEVDLVGRRLEDFLVLGSKGEVEEYLDRVLDGGSAEGTVRVRTRSGESRLLHYENTVWDGKGGAGEVRVQARDVTEQERARQALLRQVEQEELVSAIATRFIAVDGGELKLAIESALAELAGFAEVDRGVLRLVEERTGRFCESYEWSQSGTAGIEVDSAGQLDQYEALAGRLQLLETIIVEDIRDSSPEEQRELRALLGPDVRSAVIVPLVGREGLLGFFGLVSLSRERRWRHENLVLAYIAGYVFASAILRFRNEERAIRLESEVQQARRMESLGVVAAGIAHDFNNHLMAIIGNAGLVQNELPESSRAWKAAEQVVDSARRAAQLTGQMLSFSGSANLILEQGDLRDLVRETLAGEDILVPADCQLELEAEEGSPSVEVDRGQIRQVLRSLISNALEAVEGQGGHIRVRSGHGTLAAQAAPGVFRPLGLKAGEGMYVFIEVVDDGPGIERDHLPRIFEPFFSTRFQGRGLGLAAALGIVRAHRGVIEVETSPGEGTAVRVYLPAALPSEAVQAEEVADVSGCKGRGTVLVVDDEAAVVEIMSRMLRRSGFEVLTASGEGQALELLRNGGGADVGAVLLDYSLGGDDPRVVVGSLRAAARRAPLIVMSGYPREQMADSLQDLAVSGFLEKPFDRGILVSEIERVLEQ